MSVTTQLTGDASTVELFEMETYMQAIQASPLSVLFDNGGIIYVDTASRKGDTVTFDYIARAGGKPIGEGGTLVGNEVAHDHGTFSLRLNESRWAMAFPNSGVEVQRTNVKFLETAKPLLAKRAAELLTQSAFNQLAGFSATSWTSPTDGETYATTADKLHVTGHNTVTAPSTNRIVRAAGAATDQALTSSDLFSYALLDYVLEENAASLQPVEPMDDGYFHMYIDPYSFTNLKQDTTSPIQWYTNVLSEIQGGKTDKNMMKDAYMGSKIMTAGVYQNVKIMVSRDVPYGQRSDTSAVITTVRRNLLVGKNALSFTSPFGGRPDDEKVPLKFIEQLSDYGKVKGFGFELLYGLNKVIPTGNASTIEDVGVFVVPTYAAAHS